MEVDLFPQPTTYSSSFKNPLSYGQKGSPGTERTVPPPRVKKVHQKTLEGIVTPPCDEILKPKEPNLIATRLVDIVGRFKPKLIADPYASAQVHDMVGDTGSELVRYCSQTSNSEYGSRLRTETIVSSCPSTIPYCWQPIRHNGNISLDLPAPGWASCIAPWDKWQPRVVPSIDREHKMKLRPIHPPCAESVHDSAESQKPALQKPMRKTVNPNQSLNRALRGRSDWRTCLDEVRAQFQ